MNDSASSSPGETANAPRLVAVIDIGASSLRMQIAEIRAETGEARKIESFAQAVSIGQDSFADRNISKSTIEDCVAVLKVYRAKLDEYGIVDPRDIRVVATSGVREATNRMAFIDRVYVATDFEIEPFDEAELHRVTYLGILPFIEKQSKYFSGESLVLEVGGGTSELLCLSQADVLFSRTYRLGSLRLRQSIEQFGGPQSKARALLETQILQTIETFQLEAKHPQPRNLVAMGSEVRFAVQEINQQAVSGTLAELKIPELIRFTDRILEQTPDQLAARYHLSLPDAKSLGPGLLTQVMFARELGVKKFLVANSNLRDGLVQEMAMDWGWDDSIQNQIVRSALQLGRKYHFHEAHAVHVSRIACQLFDELSPVHQLPPRFRRILELASLLHEIGSFVNARSKHKHTQYLILNSEIFGIGSRDLNLIAQVARYHRGAAPSPRHDMYSQLERLDRISVAKTASILRIAKAFDVGLRQRVQQVACHIRPKRLELTARDVADLALERMALTDACGLFEDIFGMEVSLEVERRRS